MLEIKYAAKQFGSMSGGELISACHAIILKIHVITGWSIPSKELMDILIDQFCKKMVESYKNSNSEEVEYAFRNFGTTVKDWGKQMNLSLIDEVMLPYLEKRFELSRIEEQQKNKTLMIDAPKEDLSERAMKEWFNEVFKQVEQTKLSVDFMPVALYEWMDKNGNIPTTAAEKKKYLEKAVVKRLDYLVEVSNRAKDNSSAKELSDFLQMKQTGVFEGKEVNRLKDIAKKMLLFDLIKQKQCVN